MTNLLAKAAAFLQEKMEEHASELVVYERPGKFTLTDVKAVIGRTVTEEDPGTGYVIRITTRDFIISRSALADACGEPKRNDRIIQTVDGKQEVFLVNADGVDSHYQDADQFGVAWRIHTKRDQING